MNLSQVFFCFGALFSPFLVSQILRLGIPWRMAFVILGSIALIIGIVFTVLTRTLTAPPIEPMNSPGPAEGSISNEKNAVWSDKLLYLMSAALFLYVVIEGSIVVWISSYFETHLRVPASSAAWRLSIFWLGIILGRATILFLPRRWTLWPAVVVGSLGLALACLVMILRWSPRTATVVVLLAGFLGGPIWPVIVTISQNLRNSNQFTAIVIAAGALGAATGPLIRSFIIRLGMTCYFPVLAAISVLLFIVVLTEKSLSESEPHLQILLRAEEKRQDRRQEDGI